jgi:hypothetical protein
VAAGATAIQPRPSLEVRAVRGALNPVIATWGRLGWGWRLALWLLITLRLALGLVAVFSIQLDPVMSPMMLGQYWRNLLIHGGEPWSAFLSTWQRWDALWYQQIAEHGYQAGNGTVAFNPLYPLLSRIVSLPLGGQVVLAELVVSSAAFLVSMGLLYRIARLDSGPIASRLAVLLTALFPTGFFLLAPYTDSLYLALTLAAFWLARRGRPWAAGLAGFAAALTRGVFGVFLVLPLAFEYMRQRRQQGKGPGLELLAAALPALGFIGVNAYYHLVVGERGSLLGQQAAFGYQIVPPWEALAASWAHIASSGDLIEALNLVCLLGFGLLALVLITRRQIGYALYAVPYLALLFTREMWYSPLMSDSRYVLVLFPCFMLVATWLARRPWLAAGWLVAGLLLQAILLEYYVHFGFVA